MFLAARVGLLPLLIAVSGDLRAADNCAVFTPSIAQTLAQYVSARYEVAPDILAEDGGLVGGSCFRRVTFRVAAPKRVITLYLSPDQQFLSPEILNLSVDPKLERKTMTSQVERDLLADRSPTRGLANAPIKIVVFEDFQCPFCKQLNDFFNSLGQEKQKTVLVFKHRPLNNHAWARRAAVASVCADLQSASAFWLLHDYLFSKQTEITAENFDEAVKTFVAQTPEVNSGKFSTCMQERPAEAIVERDELLANLYRIDETPTVFINGRRARGFRTKDELKGAIIQLSYAQ